MSVGGGQKVFAHSRPIDSGSLELEEEQAPRARCVTKCRFFWCVGDAFESSAGSARDPPVSSCTKLGARTTTYHQTPIMEHRGGLVCIWRCTGFFAIHICARSETFDVEHGEAGRGSSCATPLKVRPGSSILTARLASPSVVMLRRFIRQGPNAHRQLRPQGTTLASPSSSPSCVPLVWRSSPS